MAMVLFASSALGLDWWIDTSCANRKVSVSRMLEDAVDTAKAITRRLDAGDENMVRAVETVMKFDYDGASVNKAFFQSTEIAQPSPRSFF